MTEGSGKQPPQEPRTSPADGEREVLEGRVIPSRRQPPPPDDPRRQFGAPQSASPEQTPDPAPWAPQGGSAAGDQGQPWSARPGTPDQGAPGGPGGPQPPPRGLGQGTQPQGPQPPLPRRQPPGAAQGSARGYRAGTPGGPGGGPQPHGGPGSGPQPQGLGPGGGPPQGRDPGSDRQQGLGPSDAQPQGRSPGSGPQSPFPRQPAPPSAPGAPSSPSFNPDPGTPDWVALAEQQAATGARRRRVMMLTGGIVAVAVIAGGVATAVVLSGKNSDDGTIAKPSSSGGTTASQQPLPPQPSFSSVAPPPPANPLDYLSTAAKDRAPLTPGSLFPGKQFLMNGRVYAKAGTAVTPKCATGARSTLAQSLTANGCRKLLRATYVNGGVAVTVGVAVFDDKARAAKLQKVAQYVAPLNGGGVADFCHAVACRMTSNAVGRYAYFAIAGLKNGKTITAQDTAALQAANEASNFTFQRIIQRGRDAAAADPSRN